MYVYVYECSPSCEHCLLEFGEMPGIIWEELYPYDKAALWCLDLSLFRLAHAQWMELVPVFAGGRPTEKQGEVSETVRAEGEEACNKYHG